MWFADYKRSSAAMEDGHRTEPHLIAVAAKHPAVVNNSLFSVGCVANRLEPWLAASPDGILLARVPVVAADGTIDQTTFTVSVVTVEAKTLSSDSRKDEFQAKLLGHKEQTHYTTYVGSPLFNDLVDRAWVPQLIHQMMVVNAPATILVVGTPSSWLYTMFCVMPPAATWPTNPVLSLARTNPDALRQAFSLLHARHLAPLAALVWASNTPPGYERGGVPPLPDWIPPHARSYFTSQIQYTATFFAFRATPEGKSVGDIRCVTTGTQRFYNRTRNNIDRHSKLAASDSLNAKVSLGAKLVMHDLSVISGNAASLYRVRHARFPAEADCTPSTIHHAMNQVGSYPAVLDMMVDGTLRALWVKKAAGDGALGGMRLQRRQADATSAIDDARVFMSTLNRMHVGRGGLLATLVKSPAMVRVRDPQITGLHGLRRAVLEPARASLSATAHGNTDSTSADDTGDAARSAPKRVAASCSLCSKADATWCCDTCPGLAFCPAAPAVVQSASAVLKPFYAHWQVATGMDFRGATCHKLFHGAPSLSQLAEFMAAAKAADRGSDASSSSGRPRAAAGKRTTPPGPVGQAGQPVFTPLRGADKAGDTAAAEAQAAATAQAATAVALAAAQAGGAAPPYTAPVQAGGAAVAGTAAAAGDDATTAAVAHGATETRTGGTVTPPGPPLVVGRATYDAVVEQQTDRGAADAVPLASGVTTSKSTEKPRVVVRVLPRAPTRSAAAGHAAVLEPPRTPDGGHRATAAAAATSPDFSGSPLRDGRVGRIDSDRGGQRPPSKRLAAAAAGGASQQPPTALGTGAGAGASSAAATSPYRALQMSDDGF
jgi:hypothetical protein